MKKSVFALLLACLLAAGAAGAPAAKAYQDLPRTHWAYADMTRAASFRIMNGTSGGLMMPDDTLTWAQYLAMLARAFATKDYWTAVEAHGAAWYDAGYQAARNQGILRTAGEFLPVTEENMRTLPMTRQDAAVLLSRVLEKKEAARSSGSSGYGGDSGNSGNSGNSGSDWYWDPFYFLFTGGGSGGAALSRLSARPASFTIVVPGTEDGTADSGGGVYVEPSAPPRAQDVLTDFYTMDAERQEAVSRLFDAGIVRGKADGSFGPGDTLRRCDGAVLLMRTVDQADSLSRGQSMDLMLQLTDADGTPMGAEVSARGYVGQSLRELAGSCAPENYKGSVPDSWKAVVSSACDSYTYPVEPMTAAERAQAEALRRVRNGELTMEEYGQMDFWLKLQGNNEQKRTLLYGDPVTDTYLSGEEAAEHMVSVQVPIWRLRGKTKSAGTVYLEVHEAVAEEIVEIFTEIYNDPEQFPIESLGGYNHWGGTIPDSEHRNGTAVDINPDANYQVRDGKAMAGSHWTPGTDPYSIGINSSVVRIFEEHGWTWGGKWSGHTDPQHDYHDYMHFSYRGR